jgi:putative thioredoxin
MMSSEYIVDVNETNFQYEVLAFSKRTPVVVDFWAEWCGPCKMLGPMLEKLAVQANGAFRLAKVNVDQNPALAMQFDIRGIPAVIGFRDGQVVAEFNGLQPENLVRDFLRKLSPTEGDLNLEKGLSLVNLGRWSDAVNALQKVLQANPDEPKALLGLAKTHLAQGSPSDALVILRNFPASKEYNTAEILIPLAAALATTANEDMPLDSDDLLAPAYQRALKLVARDNIPAALDGLLDTLREDKDYRDGEVRQVILGLLELLGDENPQTREYRAELASVLF